MELLVVILILGMAVGGVAVSWEAMIPRAKLNSAVRKLASVLSSCRSEAIARNAEFLIYYDLDEDRYWISSPYRLEGGLAQTFEERLLLDETPLEPDGIDLLSVTIHGVTYDSGIVQVAFTPTGRTSSHNVVLAQPLFERNFTIEVLGLTGLIRLHDGIFVREPPRESDFE